MEEKVIIKGDAQGAKAIPIIVLLLGLVSLVGVSVAVIQAEYYMVLPLGILCATLLVAAIILFIYCGSCSICVTDKRVYGKASFGVRVDLPVDSISAVGVIPMWKGISVATSSGAIKFLYIGNADEIHSVLSRILVDRQKSDTPVTTQIVNRSDAEEIKKYKELLDSGIISQEEFDAKKKQLLGL